MKDLDNIVEEVITKMITIKEIKLTAISISKDEKVSGKYDLMSDVGKVVAKQDFNGYGDIKVDLSADAKAALASFMAYMKEDIEVKIGVVEESDKTGAV